jgi:branched-chain amino acid transport system substrate-binding protein
MFGNRKSMTVGLVLTCALVLAACAPAATPTPQVITRVETKVVEKVVEKLITPTAVPPKPLPDEIKIGCLWSVTGEDAAYGSMGYRGAELANKARPTVLGKPVRLVLVDSKSEKAEAAVGMSRLVEQEKVVLVLGTDSSGTSMAAGEVAKKAKIPVVSNTATNPLVTLNNPWYFRVCFIDSFQGPMMAKYLVEKKGAKTAVIIMAVEEDYSVGLATYFRKGFMEATGNDQSILAMLSSHVGDTNFTAQLTTIKNLKPDVVYAPIKYSDGALMLTQAKELGLTGKSIFCDGDDWAAPELREIAGSAAEGVLWSAHYHPDAFKQEAANKFLAAYSAQFNTEPTNDVVLGYDAYMFAVDAIERAKSLDPEILRQTMAETKDWQGITGKITLDANHDPQKTMVILRAENGKAILEGTIEP